MSNPQNRVGKRIGQYRLISYITSGGMADVYRARDESLDRDAAIKVLLPRYGRDPVFVERFQREARSAARLHHPNIVQVYATGRTRDDEFYIAMQYVDGGSLDDRLNTLSKDGRVLEKNFTLHMMRQIALALSTAHRSGIVHRDLKPSNVLVRSDNTPVLTDLGIAAVQHEQKLTQTDRILGTPGYMSPEQASSGAIDGRSDIYSFGVMLFELLSGDRPFKGDTPWATINQHINTPAPDLKKIRPDLRPQTISVVKTCLAKDPAQRYQTADELAYAVEQALIAEGGAERYGAGVAPVVASTASRKAGRNATERKRPIWLYALVSLLLIAAVVGGLFAFGLFNTRAGNGTTIAQMTPTPLGADVTDQENDNDNGDGGVAEVEDPSDDETDLEEDTSDDEPTAEPTETATPTQEEEATATATDEPTETPEPTATATDEPTETPEPTATTSSSNPSGSGSGAGLPITFDQNSVWGIGDEKNGTFVTSTDRASSGSSSGKLSYTFETAKNDYVVFLQSNAISGEPNMVSARVYGDGSGHFLNVWIMDAGNQIWQVPLGQVSHSGRWALMSGEINTNQDWPWAHIRGPKNDTVEYPISFVGVVLDDLNNDYTGSGTIYIDDISASTGAIGDNGDNGDNNNGSDSSATATPSSSGEVSPTAVPVTGNIGRIIYTSGNNILTTDPTWSSAEEVGTASANTCSGNPSTISGQSFSIWRGHNCNIPEGTAVCASPNGVYEALINHTGNQIYTINIRAAGAEGSGEFIIQTDQLDRSEGFQWNPTSASFMFIIGDQIHIGFPGGGYQSSISPVYSPIFSVDGSQILYRRPVGPGVNDVFVANADGTGQANLTNNLSVDKSCAVWVR